MLKALGAAKLMYSCMWYRSYCMIKVCGCGALLDNGFSTCGDFVKSIKYNMYLL